VKVQREMIFESFSAETGNAVVLKAFRPDLQGSVQFRIGSQILVDHLGANKPAQTEESAQSCETQRDKIVAACQRAFQRHPSTRVTLTDADFENAQISPPQPPTDVAGG
jgi:hypothetical protein